MTDDPTDPKVYEFETIEPVRVDIGNTDADPARTSTWARLLPWIVVLLLLTLLAVIVTVLPGVIKPPQLEIEPATPDPASTVRRDRETASPWEEAQIKKARDAAREALNGVLEMQFALQDTSVENWAGDAYQQALARARTGDEQYRDQDFPAAEASYRDAAKALNAIEASRDDTFAALLDNGLTAIDTGRRADAITALDLALLIRPGDSRAELARQRAEVLDQVLAQLQQAQVAAQGGDHATAVKHYQQALQLDANNQAARDGLAAARAQVTEAQYTAAMSRGYAQLAAGRLEAARTAFKQAAAIRPKSAEVNEALAQVESTSTLQRIESLLAAGKQAAAAEQWDIAVEQYSRALTIDPNLVPAQEALRNTQTRQRLDEVIVKTLDDPLSLNDDKQYSDMLTVFRSARQIQPAGPRLQQQLRQFEQVLRLAREPVTLVIESDQQTQVSVLRVERLGSVASKKLSLYPGRYVVVGTRPGYRDVRTELTLAQGAATTTIRVVCSEAI